MRKLGASDAVTAFGRGETAALQTEVFGLAEDSTGTLHVGTRLGWFQYKAEARSWHWYEGAASTEQTPDFRPFDPAAPGAALPTADQPFLPAVTCLHRGPDAALWLGSGQAGALGTRRRGSTLQLRASPVAVAAACTANAPCKQASKRTLAGCLRCRPALGFGASPARSLLITSAQQHHAPECAARAARRLRRRPGCRDIDGMPVA
ncbi:MAG TPA: hypothetical protein VF331_02310 [Polyangiales bacterium]